MPALESEGAAAYGPLAGYATTADLQSLFDKVTSGGSGGVKFSDLVSGRLTDLTRSDP